MDKPNTMFLDADPSLIEKNLRFIKVKRDLIDITLAQMFLFSMAQNNFEDELDSIFDNKEKPAEKKPVVASKMIKPTPGNIFSNYLITIIYLTQKLSCPDVLGAYLGQNLTIRFIIFSLF